MTYESGYEIVVGVRLIPARASAYIVGSTKLPWSEVLREEGKGYSNVFVTESHRIPSHRQAFQESLEVAQPFDSPLVRLRTPPVKPFEPEMVFIPAGEFTMSSDASLDQDAVDGQPQRTLYLPDYYLARTPVTNAQYAAFVQATGHHPPERWMGGQPPTGKEDHPVVYVSWHDAVAYCHWLAEETGKPYRLPSEAEWEKGARSSDGRIYPWGNQRDEERCNTAGGKRGAIPDDLLDMAGNVWEWTRSVCQVYSDDPDNGRKDIRSGVGRVLRGGSWYRNQWYARCTLRYAVYPDARYHYLGFRVAASLSPKSARGRPSQTPGRFGGPNLP
jgi:formylglycine-generating enzyme required for sulfatase activity